jgi:acetyl-CoA synthetase
MSARKNVHLSHRSSIILRSSVKISLGFSEFSGIFLNYFEHEVNVLQGNFPVFRSRMVLGPIDVFLTDSYSFVPDKDFVAKSNVRVFMSKYGIRDLRELHNRSISDMNWFWKAIQTETDFKWFREYSEVVDVSKGPAWARWFVGGKCNIAYNAVDKHVKKMGTKPAYVHEDESGRKRTVTYSDLYDQSSKLARGLQSLGIVRGDVVAVYMPMVPEAVVSMLACARIGAIHNVVFSGFSASALAERIANVEARVVITADGFQRRGRIVSLKGNADQAADLVKSIRNVVTLRNAGVDVKWFPERDVWYNDLLEHGAIAECAEMDSEDPLFFLHTSGTAGKPKAAVHVHAGFSMVAACQTYFPLDLKAKDTVFWTSDLGWITGHIWLVYGVLLLGGTALLYDGVLDYPNPDRWYSVIENNHVTIFGSSPTGIRMLMKHGDHWLKGHDLGSLRVLGSTGEPLNSEAWLWFKDKIGRNRCPIFNNCGGTEIGAAILGPLPIIPLKPSTLGGPLPGFDADVVNDLGESVREKPGYLVVRKPWPSMTRGLWRDNERYLETYWSKFKDVWYHADWVLIDEDGLWFVLGRADDVIKVAGHRIGVAEVEDAVSRHAAVAEAAAVGLPDEIRGEKIVICVVLKPNLIPKESLTDELRDIVQNQVGKFARPDEVRFVSDLPKTRTGKIVRRLIKAKLTGKADLGDFSSLEDVTSIDRI